jgi:putative tryptophan/tyrosine transport system substrate-binding protein
MSGIAGGLLAAPLAVRAQPPAKVRLIGTLDAADSRGWAGFRQGLNDLGWDDERRVAIEFRWNGARDDRYRELAVELIRMNVDVLVAGNWESARAAKQATNAIPIVLLAVPDPPASGLLGDRPDRNLTGISYRPEDLATSSIEILHEIRPGLRRVALLYDPRVWASSVGRRRLEIAAARAGLSVLPLAVRERDDLETAFAALTLERPDFLIVDAVGSLAEDPGSVAQFAIKHRFPAISSSHALANAGLLMSHGPALFSMGRRAADYVNRILKGAQPVELPLDLQTKFELVINLKTAKALGLTIPPSLLQRADQVIE